MRAKRKTSRIRATRTTGEIGSAAPALLLRTEKSYRISGHETFPCRYTWLPKAVRGLAENPRLFSDEEQAMVYLGVGKNMVRAIRFWAQAAGVATALKSGGYAISEFGRTLLGHDGLDPFLEDIRTLWLIHWKLATDVENPLLAWDYLLNRWQEPDLVPSGMLKALHKAVLKETDSISLVTLEQHLETFLHTYVPTRGRKGEVQEDNLDCPLVELDLIVKIGDREQDRTLGKREPIYAFRRDEKPEITLEVFAYCLHDFWQKRHQAESTLPFREVAHGHGSPGQIFKLPEEDVRLKVETLARQNDSSLTYIESATLQQIRRRDGKGGIEFLKDIYSVELAHA
jgi:hypothetical protein